MAFYILIQKETEDDENIIYSFGPNENCLGYLALNKVSGKSEQKKAVPVDNPDAFFVRAASKLYKHWQSGQIPEKTSWES
jgi:hypothetical protein